MFNEQEYWQISKRLNVDSAFVKAISKKETRDSGFLKSGKPKILFEGHWFWINLEQVGKKPLDYVKGNEDILYKEWTRKYYQVGEKEYKRLEQAMMIDPIAAKKSASWGAFQILGVNFKECGYDSVGKFVKDQYSRNGQKKAFVNFISNQPNKLKAMRDKNFSKFARLYNGPSFKTNNYDVDLEKLYLKIRKEEETIGIYISNGIEVDLRKLSFCKTSLQLSIDEKTNKRYKIDRFDSLDNVNFPNYN